MPDEHGHGGEVHWAYEGENGPQAWGKLKPEFNLFAFLVALAATVTDGVPVNK